MVTPANNALRAVFDLYNTMTDELAAAHGTAEFEQRGIDDGWDEIPGRIASADTLLDGVIHDKSNRRQHRQARIVKSALGEMYTALKERCDAQTAYLTAEAAAKQAIADGGSADLVALDRARDQISKAQERMASDGSTLLYDLENLKKDLKG
jgi:hypothetical protein